jgi:hypothetical protein
MSLYRLACIDTIREQLHMSTWTDGWMWTDTENHQISIQRQEPLTEGQHSTHPSLSHAFGISHSLSIQCNTCFPCENKTIQLSKHRDTDFCQVSSAAITSVIDRCLLTYYIELISLP